MKKMAAIAFWAFFAFEATAQIKDKVDSLQLKADSVAHESAKESAADNLSVVSLDDNDLGDNSGQSVSSVLTAGRDPFFSATSFNWSALRFRVRGYESDMFGAFINGVPMDNLDNGFTPFGLWGGLNDVMRNRDLSIGLRPNSYSYGELGSVTNIDVRASKQRKQTELEYDYSNRNYTHKVALTWGSGISKKGWAFALSGSRRYADEGYVPGSYYNGWSYFAAIDKRISQKSILSLVAFGAPTENGRQGAAVQEMYYLAGTNYYNPNWGYQNGKKRNANVGKSHQPVFVLSQETRFNNHTSLNTGLGVSFGNRSTTALDWYNAADPRPDYYRKLPSYITTYDPIQAAAAYNLLSTDENARQINWQNLYNINRDSKASITNADNIPGNTLSGQRSRYIIDERIVNTNRLNFNMVLNSRIGKLVDFTGGVSYQWQKNHYFKKVNDLLGGDFYVNWNQFAERNTIGNIDSLHQNDADHPNRILNVGDKWGYDYNIVIGKASSWLQTVIKLSKIDIFLAGQYSNTRFYREGLVRNGLFPNDVIGKGVVNNFDNYSLKAGITYKINGRNYLYANGTVLTRAPYFENAYESPRTRYTQQQNVVSEKIQSVEGGYILNAPKVKIRLSGYYTQFKDGLDVMSYYDDAQQNFVNYAINSINKEHFGGEFGIEANLVGGLSVNAAASVGRYYYSSKQLATVTIDNSAAVVSTNEVVYAKNFRVPSTPQEAYNLGLNYRSPKFWFVSLTGNYFRQNYLSINPIRRTEAALQDIPYQSEAYNAIFDQTKFDDAFTLDFFGSWSKKLPKSLSIAKKSTFFILNAGVNNILNSKDINTGGFEQLRYDKEDGPGKFQPKLYYAYGINFFLSATLRF